MFLLGILLKINLITNLFFRNSAFATCAGYGSHLAFQVTCKNADSKPALVRKRDIWINDKNI